MHHVSEFAVPPKSSTRVAPTFSCSPTGTFSHPVVPDWHLTDSCEQVDLAISEILHFLWTLADDGGGVPVARKGGGWFER